MNGKIYLGFAGKENLRLGESLSIIDKCIYVTSKYMNSIPIERLEEYISNPYIMYNIKDVNTLLNIFNYTTGTMLLGQLVIDKNNNFLNAQKEEEYIVSMNAFKFLSEKVWPRISENFAKNIRLGKNHFILRFNFPLSIIEKLYDKDSDYIKTFVDEFSKWIEFHFIGKISKMSDENENLTIYLDVKY